MKKQSFFNRLFKKKSSFPEDFEGEEKLIVEQVPEDTQYEVGDSIDSTPFDIPIPEMDEKAVIGEIDIYVNNEKTATHKIESHTKIGRDPSQSDIIISELIVSKLHCTIYVKDGTIYVKDNDSTNGTYVNNQKITAEAIGDNTVIGLGRRGTVKIVFRKGVRK